MINVDLDGLIEKSNRVGTVYYVDKQGEIISKKCLGCDVTKKLCDFNKDRESLAGKESRCKECRSKDKQKWRATKKSDISYRRREAKRNQEYYKTNKERKINYVRKWREVNPEKEAIIAMRRRARKKELPNTLTSSEWEAVFNYFNRSCALTGRKGEVQRDHVIPLSIGRGGTILGNIIPLHRDLNASKYNLNFFDWFAESRESFGLDQRRFDEIVAYLAESNGMTAQEYEQYVRWCHDNPRYKGEEVAE